jgi:hypothetical protein
MYRLPLPDHNRGVSRTNDSKTGRWRKKLFLSYSYAHITDVARVED